MSGPPRRTGRCSLSRAGVPSCRCAPGPMTLAPMETFAYDGLGSAERVANESEHPPGRRPSVVGRGAISLLGRLAGEMLLQPLGILLGAMHRAVLVLGRSVQRVQLQRLVSDVPYVVPRAGGDDDRVVALDLGAAPVDRNLAFSLFHPEEL